MLVLDKNQENTTGQNPLVLLSSQQGVRMETEVFEDLMMTVLVGGLILFMAFIVWDLAKKSKAGRYGSAVLFFALGLGVLGFLIKTIVIAVKGL